MLSIKQTIQISVCIPVYNTEPYLEKCLQSIANQDFHGSVEVLVVSDASSGHDELGRNAEKIVKQFKKDLSIRYLENSHNLALVETRRRLVNEARGTYIFMLDSDDFLPEYSLSRLYQAAKEYDADIVQGDCITLDKDGNKHIESLNEFHPVLEVIEGKSVFDDCFCNEKYRAVVTARLIRRSIYLRAFSQIPYIRVHMAEEVIQYFFIALYSNRYVGIKDPVYFYRIGTGITTKSISDLEEWRKVCSTASVITAIYSWIDEKTTEDGICPLDSNELNAIKKCAKFYCINNVKQLKSHVIPELYNEAHSMLCAYWGNEAIRNTETFLAIKK